MKLCEICIKLFHTINFRTGNNIPRNNSFKILNAFNWMYNFGENGSLMFLSHLSINIFYFLNYSYFVMVFILNLNGFYKGPVHALLG